MVKGVYIREEGMQLTKSNVRAKTEFDLFIAILLPVLCTKLYLTEIYL